MIKISNPWIVRAWFSALVGAGLCAGCSGTSDSETAPGTGGTASSTGGSSTGGSASGGISSASGGTSSGGSSPTLTGGSSSLTGGASSASGGSAQGGKSASGGSESTGGKGGQATGGESGECMPRESVTLAIHIVMNITWPDTLATTKGSGKFHLWNKTTYDVTGTAVSGETQPCGSVLPPLDLSVIAGGGKTLIEIPDATWDLPSMPRAADTGMLAGWTAGSKFVTDGASALVGLTLADPKGAWPSKGSGIMGVDHDGDSKPGIKGIPKSDGGFVRPPTSILGQAGPIVDQVYLVTRTAVALDGAMTSCSEQSGTAKVTYFDNHVVGCHVYNGGECDATQADFIDTNRTIYAVSDASFTAKFVSDSATCAEVRAALPQ